jgi:RNA polymerase sigma factor (sigma-70 family)
MSDSRQLLDEYATTGSEAAFGELVTRYIDLVYSTAFRLVDGDSYRAKDVSQIVFLDLSREACRMSEGIMLGGWLHRHTCFVARKAMRGERRREFRERQAAEMNALNNPDRDFEQMALVLDEAINELGEEDRKAIVLRFYERLDLRGVGQALGSTENAAQKRVTRALDQLHLLVMRRGVALSLAALGTALSCEAVKAAPVGLAASIVGTVVVGETAGAGTLASITKGFMITKTKFVLIGGLLAGTVAAPLAIQHHAQVQVQAENAALRQQVDALNQVAAENERLSNLVAQVGTVQPAAPDEKTELLRLRGEVGRLLQESKDTEALRQEVRRLRSGQAAGTTGADNLAQYLGTTVEPPANLEPAYSKQGLLDALQLAARNAGVSLKKVQVEDSEFPYLLGVITEPGDWEKLKAQLRKLDGYEYSGAVGSDTFNAFNITPPRILSSPPDQNTFRRISLRMQVFADRLNVPHG